MSEFVGVMPMGPRAFTGCTVGAACRYESSSEARFLVCVEPQIFVSDGFATALARQLGLSCQPLCEYDTASRHPNTIVVDTCFTAIQRVHDEPQLKTFYEDVQQAWVLPLQARIQSGDSIQLEIYNEGGEKAYFDGETLHQALVEACSSGYTAGFQLGRGVCALLIQALTRLKCSWRYLLGKVG